MLCMETLSSRLSRLYSSNVRHNAPPVQYPSDTPEEIVPSDTNLGPGKVKYIIKAANKVKMLISILCNISVHSGFHCDTIK